MKKIHQTVIQQVHHARDRSECAPITKVMEMVRSTSTPSSPAMVDPARKARMSRAEPGPRHQPGEDRQQHDGGDDDDDLHVGELHHEAAATLMQRVTAGNDRGTGFTRAPCAICE